MCAICFYVRGGEAQIMMRYALNRWYEQKIKNNRISYWTGLATTWLKELPDINLTKSELKEIDSFYSGYFAVNTLFHKFYKAATGCFDVRYIPDDIYYTVIDPYFNDWSDGAKMDNKTFYRWYFPDVRQPETICYRQNMFWFDENQNIISEATAIEKILKYDIAFIKSAQYSMGGHGISVIISQESSTDEVKNIIKKYVCDIVVQKKLVQSKVMSLINDSSVNTIRLMTFLRKDGSVKICSVSVRMGMVGSYVDNASSGGITCGVRADGRLNCIAYAANGKSYSFHPTSGIKFDQIKIPNFEKVKEIVSEKAQKMPKFRLISWDIAIDENDELILIETNLFVGELEFHQLSNGPIFGDETEAILDEINNNPKTITYPF